MVRSRPAALLRRLALIGAVLALSACATVTQTSSTQPEGERVATDGGIRKLGGSATGNYLAGRQAGLERDTQTAAAYFGEALRADPDNAAILERAFLLSLASGHVADSVKLAAKLDPATPAGRIGVLTASADALKHARYADALKLLQSGTPADMSDVTWVTIRAWTYAGLGKPDDGLALLQAKDVRAALGAFGLFHEAMILEYAKRNADAERAYAAALTASGGRSVRALEGFGRFLEREGKTADAVKLYKTYLSVMPGHPVVVDALARAEKGARKPAPLIASPAEGAAEALYGVSVVLAGEHAIDLPVIYTQIALHMAPNHDPAHALLGDLYEQQEDWASAVKIYSLIPANSPVAHLAAVSIARDLARLDRVDEAIALLTKWSGGETDSQTLVTLGDLYRTQQKWDEAASAYDRALKAIPSNDPRSWQLLYAKGISLERGGKWDQAEPLLRQALALEPDQPQILNYLGYSWIDRGKNLKEALALIDKAVAQRPDDGYVVDSLGWAYYRLGDYQNAVYYLERAVELRADDATINDHLGDAYWKIGRKLEARFQWSHALSFRPSNEEAVALKQKLESGLGLNPNVASGTGSGS